MTNKFGNLNLSVMQAEEEEDELDRIMAANQAEKPEETVVKTDVLSDLLEDEDEAPQPQVALKLPVKRPVEAPVAKPVETTPARAPKFGEKGFGKGVPKPHKGSPRARATENTAILLGFLGKMGVATVEACSLLRLTKESPVSVGGQLTAMSTTYNTLTKFKRLGYVENSWTYAGIEVWGPTPKGIAVARDFGYLQEEWEATTTGLNVAPSHYDHFRSISLLAAQLMSPAGLYKESLGFEAVRLDQLITEGMVRGVQKPIADKLKAEAIAKKVEADFGAYRNGILKKAFSEVAAKKLRWDELLEYYPELWTMGQPISSLPSKQTHWPDLVVSFEKERSGAKSSSLAFEVELSFKLKPELGAILRTMAADLEHQSVFGKVVYVSDRAESLATLVKDVDRFNEFGLFEQKKLEVLPLLNRDGEPAFIKKRLKRQPTWV